LLVASLLRPGVLERRSSHVRSHAYGLWDQDLKRNFVHLWDSKGWKDAHAAFPQVPWSTAEYWRQHPAVLESEGKSHSTGAPSVFLDEEEEEIRTRVLSIPAPNVLDLIQIALNRAATLGAQFLSRRHSLNKFKAEHHWLTEFCTRKRLRLLLHIPHPVS
jgi:hypothetical protein